MPVCAVRPSGDRCSSPDISVSPRCRISHLHDVFAARSEPNTGRGACPIPAQDAGPPEEGPMPGRRRESHPPSPTDPDVSLAAHPARAVQSSGLQYRSAQCAKESWDGPVLIYPE